MSQPTTTVKIEAREWLNQPGERDLVYGGQGYENYGKKLVESLYKAGALRVLVVDPFHGRLGDDYQSADTLLIESTPHKEGDVLIALAGFSPDETHRLTMKVKNRNRRWVRAWWD